MKKKQVSVNDKFGYWSVIDPVTQVINGHRHIKCQCKCGKIKMLSLSDLTNNRTTGCKSCKAQERKLPIKIKDKYKNWEVISGPKVSSYQSVQWEVICLVCKTSTRWIQGNELINPTRCFCCRKCASKKMFLKETKKRGRIGELTITQHTRLKRSAENRNLDFNVSIKYLWSLFIKQNYICAITGDALVNIKTASLDRIDSNKGYIKGNVQWVTKQANLSKHIMSTIQLVKFCQKVLKHANQQPS